MTYDHIIRPETRNILGNSQKTSTSTHCSNIQEESTPRQSLWERIKSGAKKVFGYIKDEIVPIAMAVAGIMNAWSNWQRWTGKVRGSACYT